MRRYDSYAISKVFVSDHEIQIQGKSTKGDKREFVLVFNRDMATNQLSVGVARHFTDPNSIRFFADSEPWTEDEVRGDG